MELAIAVILAIIFLATVLLSKTVSGIPAKELRRLARGQQNKRAAAVYRLSVYGGGTTLFLWLVGSLSAAGLILLAANYAWWLALTAVLAVTWLIWLVRPINSPAGWLWYLASLAAVLANPAIGLLQPPLIRLSSRRPQSASTKLYETEDLTDLLKWQGRQRTSRIPQSDLATAVNALNFSTKVVTQVMLPRRRVKWVTLNDPIGPLVMDELHQSGQSSFGVVKEIVKSGNPEVIGTLYISDLLTSLDKGGRVRDVMQPRVAYVNESENLMATANIFLKTQSLLLVVINNFEEVVGILTLDDLLKQIYGDQLNTEQEPHQDKRAAASHEAGQPTEPEVK